MTWTDRDDLRFDNWIDEHKDQLFAEINQRQTLGPPDLDDPGIREHFEPAASEYWRTAHDRVTADFLKLNQRACELEFKLRQQVFISFACGLVLLAVVICRVWGN